jgi:hypothetical protein
LESYRPPYPIGLVDPDPGVENDPIQREKSEGNQYLEVLDVIFGGLAAGDFFCSLELRRNTYGILQTFLKRGIFFKRKKDSRKQLPDPSQTLFVLSIPNTVQDRYRYWLDQGPLFERRFSRRRPSKRAGFVVIGENFINPNKFH